MRGAPPDRAWVGAQNAVEKSLRTLRDEGPSVFAVKARYNIVEGLGLMKSRTRSSDARELVVGPDPVPRRAAWPHHLMIVVPNDLDPRYRRRLDHRLATAELAGLPTTVTTLGPWHEIRSLVHLSSTLVMYHAPWSRTLERTVHEANRLRIPVVFEACGPIHDAGATGDAGLSPGLAPDERLNLAHDCQGYLRSLRLADHVLAGRPDLAAALGSHVAGRSFVLPAGFDTTLAAYQRGLGWEAAPPPSTAGSPRDTLTIGYDSYAKGWDPHLASITSALATILETRPGVILRIAGNPDVPDRLAPLRNQIEVVPTQVAGERLRILSASHILIAPWATKWAGSLFDLQAQMAAALLGLPFVASSSAYAGLIESGQTGLLCSSRSDWVEALESLLQDPDRRQDLGTRGQARWCADGAQEQAVQNLTEALALMRESERGT